MDNNFYLIFSSCLLSADLKGKYIWLFGKSCVTPLLPATKVRFRPRKGPASCFKIVRQKPAIISGKSKFQN